MSETPKALLAEALGESLTELGPEADAWARDILATPAGARLLALAEVGAAVERLQAAVDERQLLVGVLWPTTPQQFDDDGWQVRIDQADEPWKSLASGNGKTLPEAIVAALEDQP